MSHSQIGDAQAVQTLNTLALPFGGNRLIEASAGTGKTYTISGLYLRLLLGHDIEQPLSCEQILVVTFTNAATGELRDRIRSKIQLAYRRFIGLTVQDELINQLYDATLPEHRANSLRHLDLALKSLDEAAIYTIHGFCQRILADMAFESSLLFESEFVLDDGEYLHHAVRDFWREACYPLPKYIAAVIQKQFADPDALSKQLRALIGANQAQAKPKPASFTKASEQLSQCLSRLQLIWPREKAATEALLHSLPLNGTRFGKKADNYPKLAAMFDNMDNWVANTQAAGQLSLPATKTLEGLALSGLKLNKGGEIPSVNDAPLLAHIDNLLGYINGLIPSFLYAARAGISQRFYADKQQRNLMSPDDLLLTLSGALTQSSEARGSNRLAQSIAKRFPVGLIDEFQDTDPLQFNIFNSIYSQTAVIEAQPSQGSSSDNSIENSQTGKLSLLMIGDPKQAIYAFRGADIHTYINARQQTAERYSLDTNYRSSARMVQAVNQLFSLRDDPFINQAIPFDSVKSAPNAASKCLTDSSGLQSALRVRVLSEDEEVGLNKTTARQHICNDVADEITRLLNEAAQGACYHGHRDAANKRALVAKDIAVLVRDRHEAQVIRDALRKRNIGSVFLSRDSVFDTVEAKELALLLTAMANPKDERALRSALATSLLGYDAQAIHNFNQDEEVRQTLLSQFADLHQLWLKRGVMPALLSMASITKLIERILQTPDGERRLTDFRHLGELLQQKSTEIDGVSALLNWYEQALLENNGNEEAQLRLESEQNLVQIVTIHKSKGLEYPLCFVPFVSLSRDSRRKPSPMLYHQDNQLIWDIEQTDDGWALNKQEALAEDLRLLYVALTRPVLGCYLYIANHSRVTKRAGINSQLHQTAIGYLLGINDKNCDALQLDAAVQPLVSDAISVAPLQLVDAFSQPQVLVETDLSPTQLQPVVVSYQSGTPWRVGSYSGLVKNLPHEHISVGAGDEQFPETETIEDRQDDCLDRFSFERGANAGSFMHLVLELIDFTQAQQQLPEQLPIAMQRYGIAEQWYTPLLNWYNDIIHTPLFSAHSTVSPRLADISDSQRIVEMEFYLPLSRLTATALNRLLKQYGYSEQLNFDDLTGMLKGFIDLTFEYQGQFYIADYKSNHLGSQFSHYQHQYMGAAIASHRYDLQYIIYTVALHRYLKLRVPGYQYDTHIGGCYYLFLRGMSCQQPQAGVFFDRPDRQLILAIDQLFEVGDHANDPHNSNSDTAPNDTNNGQAQLEQAQTELPL